MRARPSARATARRRPLLHAQQAAKFALDLDLLAVVEADVGEAHDAVLVDEERRGHGLRLVAACDRLVAIPRERELRAVGLRERGDLVPVVVLVLADSDDVQATGGVLAAELLQ